MNLDRRMTTLEAALTTARPQQTRVYLYEADGTPLRGAPPRESLPGSVHIALRWPEELRGWQATA
jgi:hypothetical protein